MDIAWADVLRGALSFFLVVVGSRHRIRLLPARRHVRSHVGDACARSPTRSCRSCRAPRRRSTGSTSSCARRRDHGERRQRHQGRREDRHLDLQRRHRAGQEGVRVRRRGEGGDGDVQGAQGRGPTTTRAETPPTPPPDASRRPAAEPAPVETARNGRGSEPPSDLPPELRNRDRGPSMSQISWALPKRHDVKSSSSGSPRSSGLALVAWREGSPRMAAPAARRAHGAVERPRRRRSVRDAAPPPARRRISRMSCAGLERGG